MFTKASLHFTKKYLEFIFLLTFQSQLEDFTKIEFLGGPKNDFWSFLLCISIFSWEGKKGEQIFQCKYEFFFCFLFKITNKRKNGLVLNDFLQKYRDDTKFRENARPLKFCLFFISVSYVRNNFFLISNTVHFFF